MDVMFDLSAMILRMSEITKPLNGMRVSAENEDRDFSFFMWVAETLVNMVERFFLVSLCYN